MRKLNFLLLSLAFIVSESIVAQFKIYPNGNVAIQTNKVPQSTFAINSEGLAKVKAYIECETNGIYIKRSVKPALSNWGTGLEASVTVSGGFWNVGLIGIANTSINQNSGRAIGSMGRAGSATTGYNYGLLGVVEGDLNGVGVYGSSASGDYGDYISGRYAGYFRGDVKVTGNLRGLLLTNSISEMKTSSRYRYLSNCRSEQGKVSDRLTQLNIVQYNILKEQSINSKNSADTLDVKAPLTRGEQQIFDKKHFGLIASELKNIYPELVYEDSEGEMSINYIEMIPLLIQSIGELKSEINELRITNYSNKTISTNLNEDLEDVSVKIDQNEPNPFTFDTKINFSLPANVKEATLSIYNLNGTRIKEILLEDRGNSFITLQGQDLSEGMYIYSLIADGKLIDSKKMTLKK